MSPSLFPHLSNGPASRPTISIQINNHYQSTTYTTSSTISGHVFIWTERNLEIDRVGISFVGSNRTRADTRFGITEAIRHPFLSMDMNVPMALSHPSRVHQAGQSYRVPFKFVIPSALPGSSLYCRYHAKTETVRQHHLFLPPTLGMDAWDDKDDFSPALVHVEYKIKAAVFPAPEANGKPPKPIETSKAVKILPANPEEPPLEISPKDRRHYAMFTSKTLRKAILGSKIGKMSVSASQPRAVMLSVDGRSISSTTAVIQLSFYPESSDIHPPHVCSVASKISAVTYFTDGGFPTFPNINASSQEAYYYGHGVYSTNTSLPSTAVDDKITWRHCTPSQEEGGSSNSEAAERGSEDPGPQQSHTSSPKGKKKEPPECYKASLSVPINLPTKGKMFLPTFHSCTMSRFYVLRMTVNFSIGSPSQSTTSPSSTSPSITSPGFTSPSITIKIPLQVGVECSWPGVDRTGLPSFETAVQGSSAGPVAGSQSLPAYDDLRAPRAAAPQ